MSAAAPTSTLGTGSSRFEVDDPAAARGVLARVDGVRSVTDEPPGITVELDGTTRAALVAALVHGGVGVETVTARRRLEDAFLGLVEADR